MTASPGQAVTGGFLHNGGGVIGKIVEMQPEQAAGFHRFCERLRNHRRETRALSQVPLEGKYILALASVLFDAPMYHAFMRLSQLRLSQNVCQLNS